MLLNEKKKSNKNRDQTTVNFYCNDIEQTSVITSVNPIII